MNATPRARAPSALRAIVLDDDPQIQALLEKQLAAIGYSVVLSKDAGEFLSLIMSPGAAFSLAILDVNLPGLSGDEVYRWIRDSETLALNQLPVIFLTGHADKIPKDVLSQGRRCAVVEKPHSLDVLRRALDQLSLTPK